MKKGIIFDMDGTLWDSAAGVAESWNEAILAYGYERKPLTAGDIQSVMGKTMEDIADILFPELNVMQRKELLDLCCRLENDYLRRHGGVLYPDIRKTMEKLKVNYHLYIVSNCQAGYIEAFLDYYKFHDLIEDIESYGNNDKPKGENIALLYHRNNLEDAVYVGDIQGDYDASMSAGVRFIHAGYGFGKVEADVPEIQKFSDLIEVIDTVWN